MVKKIKIDQKITNKLSIFFASLLIVLKTVLMMGIPIFVIGDSAYDDNLFIKLSNSILEGQWLGAFDKRTLLKRPMFAIYLAFIRKCNLSYRLSLLLLYVVALIVFIYALRYVIHNKWVLGSIFFALLYSPIMIHSMYTQRVYRLGVMPASVILAVSTLLGLYFSLRKNEKWIKTLGWSAAAGACFFFFWNMREDSIWLLPFFACALFVAFVQILMELGKNKKAVIKIIYILIPIGIVLLGNHMIKWQNYKHYGVYTDSEMNHSEFGKLMSTMYAVKSDDEYEFVNLTKNTVQKIIAVSPSLQTMQEELDKMYASGWVMQNGEIAGGYITYAFRDALAQAEHYENAVEKEAFCKKVRSEIETAMEDGRLEATGGMYSASYLLGKKGANYKVLIPKLMESFRWVITCEKMKSNVLESSGKKSTIRSFEVATNDLAIYPPEERFEFIGYGFAKDDSKELRFVIEEPNGTLVEIRRDMSSRDVFEYYINQGILYKNAENCRFKESREYDIEKELKLHLYLDGEKIKTLDMWSLSPEVVETDDYIYCIDTIGIKRMPDELAKSGGMMALINQIIIRLYQILSIPIFILATVSYGGLTYAGYLSKRNKKEKAYLRELWLISTGILLSVILVTAGITYRYAEAVNSGGRDFYLCSAYMMYQLFVGVVLGYGVTYLVKWENFINESDKKNV